MERQIGVEGRSRIPKERGEREKRWKVHNKRGLCPEDRKLALVQLDL